MKMKRNIHSNNRGVTEIIGTMLLLGIAVSLFSVVYYSVLSAPAPVSTPSAYIVGSLDTENNQIVFYHMGGEPISGSNTILIHKGKFVEEKTISSYDVGDEWEMGEKIIHPIYNINDTYIDALIIDEDSNSIVSSAVLQKGYSDSSAYVETMQALGTSKRQATLVMRYDFVTSSGNLFFSYRKAESGDSWTNTTPESKSGYGMLMQPISTLEIDQTYEYKAVMNVEGTQKIGNTLEFTTSTVNLNTWVNDLPDTITGSESPFNISATGDPDLDNVTLYYRYSTDGGSTWVTSGGEGNWWNNNWDKRKEFTVAGSPSGEVIDYPLPITVHYGMGSDSARHVYLNDSCQNDFDDIRFITQTGKELPYYLEQKKNGDKALFWVSIDSIPAAPNNVSCYLYYDNPVASSNSDPFSTFSSFEGFEESSFIFDTSGDHGIQLVQEFTDAKQGSACAGHTDSSETYRIQMQNDQEFNAEEYEFGTWVKIESGWSGNDGLGPAIAFCCEPGKNKGYQVTIDAREDDSPQIRKDTLHSGANRVDGDYQVSNSQWYFISGYKNKDGKIIGLLYTEEQYYEGTPQTTTEMNLDVYDSGYHGLFVYGRDYQFWDAVRVRKHVDSEPRIISWEDTGGNSWEKWDSDEEPQWYWNFDFGEDLGYYEFISIGRFRDDVEDWPEDADESCTYVIG